MSKTTKLFILLLIIYIGLGLPDSLLSTTWPDISENLGVNVANISILSMITIFFSMLSSNSTFKLNNKFGERNVIVGSMVLCLLGIIIFLAFQSYASLIIVQMIMGFGAGAIDSNVNFIASQNLKVGQINLLHGFWGVGITITPLITTLLYSIGYGYIAVFFVIAILFVILIAYSLIYRNLLEFEQEAETAIKNVKLKKEDFLGLSIYFVYGVEFVIGTFLASYLVTVINLTTGEAAFIVSCYWGALMVSRLIMPLLFKVFKSYQIMLIHMFLLLIAAPLINTSDVKLLIVSYMLIGYSFGPVFPTFIHYTECIHKQNTSFYISKQISSMYMAIFLSQIFIGLVAARKGLGFFSSLVTVLIYLLIVLILLFLKKYNQQIS